MGVGAQLGQAEVAEGIRSRWAVRGSEDMGMEVVCVWRVGCGLVRSSKGCKGNGVGWGLDEAVGEG